MHQPIKKLLLLMIVFRRTSTKEYFDVLSVKEVPFPTSEVFAARLNISYTADNITEMTICLRLLIESYNNGVSYVFTAWENFPVTFYLYFCILWETGLEMYGYQSMVNYFTRTVTGGGLGRVGFPHYLIMNVPRNLGTGEWFHYCFSYSTILKKVHSFGNGLKILSYEFYKRNIYSKV